MRISRWLPLVVAAALFAGSLFVYPTALQACSHFAVDATYYDLPDANGNCPLEPTNPVGGYSIDCDGNYMQWGVQGGCNFDRFFTECSGCDQQG